MRIRPENFGECLARIQARGSMGPQEALDVIQEVARRGDEMRRSGQADPFVSAAADIADELRDRARNARLDALRNLQARKAVLDDVERNGGIGNAALTLRSWLHGTSLASRDSVQALWRGLASNWQAVLSSKLRQAGLEKIAITGALDKEVAEAMRQMSGSAPNPDVQVSAPARTIAEAYKPLIDNVRTRLNDLGARIGDALDHIAHTEHNPRKMRLAAGYGMTADQAFQSWWRAEQPRWSEETYRDLTPRDGESEQQARTRFGRSVFDALVSGVHMTAKGATGLDLETGYVPPAFEGSYNIARKVSQPRVIIYKDSQAWLDHMRQFGSSNSIGAAVMKTLDQGARQVALMSKLGTNPAANLNLIIRRIQEQYRGDGVAKFKNRIAGINNVMGRLDGSLNVPEHQMGAAISASVRTWESLSSLGGVGITHFASIWPTVTSELVHHGVPRLQTLGNMVAALVKGKGSAERQEVLAQLGAYAAGMARDMHARWQADDPIPGRLSSLANTFMKWTGIHYVFDNTQAGVREMLANQLARYVGKGFGELDPHLSQMLGKYGIGEAEWDALRAVPDLPVADGRSYMTPDIALRIGRRDLADKLLSYYSDAADHAVVTPGVRERAALLGGTRPGSLAGELLRFTTQFKMWPAAALSQVIGREIYMSLSKKEAAANLFTLAALSAAFGYLRMSVNDVAAGRPVRNPLDPATALAGLAQGGGLGIMGDFLFGEVNRAGGGIVSTMMGPIASDADTLVQIFNRFRSDATGQTKHRNGTFADIFPDLAHFASRHVPFANLIYLKGAFDYMLWYHLFEAASPGWFERSNRRLQREQGRTMVGYSPGGGVPWGIPPVYMQNRAGQTFGLLGGHQ